MAEQRRKDDKGKGKEPSPLDGELAPADLRRISSALDRAENGKVSALSEGDRVLLMIQDAPEELRRLADAMEKIGVHEIKALVAYEKPGADKLSGLRAERPALESGLLESDESDARPSGAAGNGDEAG